ncbi:lyase family protein [Kitasatospora kazusensis]|uniref:Lyase family protein n=1 Tax=Kitasatospora kazusensis TaxID=407974 RepID=A0ABN2YXX8_9ACTN
MTPTGADSGLLAPVWAGTPVQTATADEAWLQAMLDTEVALVRAQARLGVVPAAAVAPIAAAARADRLDLAGLARRSREAANPVVAFVQDFTALVAAADPEAARYVHYGSTSQDILDSAAMLVARRALALTAADLERTADALARLAETHRATPMAGRTLAQHAVPVTFGLRAAGWLELVLTALTRIRELADRLPAELGGAAGTLAGYHEYARAAGAGSGLDLLAPFAEELGLAEPVLPWHVIRVPIADLGAALAVVTGALGKIAADVQLLSRTEIAEAAEPAADGRGASSAMPQKRNPVLSTLILSAARQVPAYALILNQSMLAEEERPGGAWHAEWQPLRECLRLAGGAAHTAAELLEGLEVDAGRMRANLGLTGGAVVAERVAAVLGEALGRPEAKRLLTAATAEAAAKGRPLGDVLGELLPDLRLPAGLTLDQLLDPVGYLGESEALVGRALMRYRGLRELRGARERGGAGR